MAASEWDYPEHFKVGLKPHGPQEKYYFARGPQLVNRVVDIAGYSDQKVYANMANITQGPAGNLGARLGKKLASEGRRLAILGDNDDTANRGYTKQFPLPRHPQQRLAHPLQPPDYFHPTPPHEPH